VKYSQANHYTYIVELEHGGIVNKMDHLVCFVPGMLALDGNPEHLKLAKEIMRTCYQFYVQNPTGLAPEIVGFASPPPGKDFYNQAPHNLLRPETVESLMILYRVTGDKMYQEWGWDVFLGFEKSSKTEESYSAIEDVGKFPVSYRDRLDSFFFSETLKYLYLLFCPPHYISLNDFVFNTEAHPTRKFYPQH